MILFILMPAITFAEDGGDFGGPKTCGPLKFHYMDEVQVSDASQFYYGCKGEITNRSADCSYFVEMLCGDQISHFIADQLKLVKKGER